MKISCFLIFMVLVVHVHAQNVGINNSDPASALDINGALRLRPTELNATSNMVTIQPNTGHVVLIGSPTGVINVNDLSGGADGSVLIIDNLTAQSAVLEDVPILAGSKMIFMMQGGIYQPVDGGGWLTHGNNTTDPAFDFLGTINNMPLIFRTNNTEKMRLTTGGTLGLGTTTPNALYKLDVIGNVSASGLRTFGINNSLIFHDQTRPTREFRWSGSGGYARFKYVPHASDAIIVDSLNRVSIGGVNPTVPFEVTNTNNSQIARFNGANNMWITLAENGSNRGFIGSNSGNAEDVELGTYSGNNTGKVHLSTGNLPRLSVDGSGNVGIGELPSAGNRLTVSGGDLVIRENGAPALLQLDSDWTNEIEFIVDNASRFVIGANEQTFRITRSGLFLNQDFMIDQDGSIGISTGLADPVSKLHIAGGVVDASYTLHGYLVTGSIESTNLVIDNNEILARSNGAESDLFIQHDGGHLLLCGNEQGAVGIGLLNGSSMPAGSLLAVDGKITCEEVVVKLSQNWPDYVFDEAYALKPLSEVKAFIKEHNHLPGIPNAKSIEVDGLELGALQHKMMEKIEELTLYVIKLEEEIQELKKNSGR